jgi:hypothetical protein
MKTKKPQSFKMQLLLFTLLICSTTQAQRWRLGGNSSIPAADDITAPGANQLGSQAGFNVPINFITNGTQRMTIYQNGIAPSLNFGGGVGIHRNSAIPIAIPGALLHIGNDNIGLTSTDIGKRGWRNWMEIGTFMMGNTDNVYLGLKNEGSFNNVDRYDAILNWGDNSTSSPAPPPRA